METEQKILNYIQHKRQLNLQFVKYGAYFQMFLAMLAVIFAIWQQQQLSSLLIMVVIALTVVGICAQILFFIYWFIKYQRLKQYEKIKGVLKDELLTFIEFFLDAI